MTIYIDTLDELHVDYQGIALTCPHCQTLTHVTPVAVPKFDGTRQPPAQAHRRGVSLRRLRRTGFLKFVVRAYTPQRVELADNYIEIERARENFPLTYLPEEAEVLFKEALSCFSANCFNAFGAMCRRTAQSLFRELGERGKLELFDTLQQIRDFAALDDDTFGAVRGVLFGSDSDPWPHQPVMNAERAGILLEVMRDLLYQTFVRKARLKQAITFRKFISPAPAEAHAGHVLARRLSRRRRGRCGTTASSRRPPPTRAAPRNFARRGRRAPDAA